MNRFERYVSRLVESTNRISWICVLGMMFLTSLDVALRFSLGRPIYGSIDIVSFLQAICVAFGLAYTFLVRGHVTVELVTQRLPQRARAVINSITCFISIGVFLLLGWRNTVYATDLWRSGTLSPTLWIPFFPIVYILTFICVLVCLVLFLDLFKSVKVALRK